MRIDSHHHLWSLVRGDYGWLTPALAPIYRDFGTADLEPLLAAHGIDATILVQAAPTEAETAFMLATARASDRVAGVVGWADFCSPDAPERIARLAEEKLLVGLRPMVQDIADDDWLLSPAVGAALEAMRAKSLVFDALALPRHLSRLLVVADRHPDLPIVVDHLAKPFIAAKELDPWRADMAALAARPNTFCKLSGMVTEAAPDWTVDDLRPYAEHVIEVFGPARMLWGSDWPVVDLAGGYSRWFSAAEALTAHLSAEERGSIFGGTAERVYLSERGRKPC
jgi:L-fuconolactonase